MQDDPGSRRVDLFDSTYGHFTEDVQGAVRRFEGEERFEGLQLFFDAVHTLTRDRKLSRVAYVAEKPER